MLKLPNSPPCLASPAPGLAPVRICRPRRAPKQICSTASSRLRPGIKGANHPQRGKEPRSKMNGLMIEPGTSKGDTTGPNRSPNKAAAGSLRKHHFCIRANYSALTRSLADFRHTPAKPLIFHDTCMTLR